MHTPTTVYSEQDFQRLVVPHVKLMADERVLRSLRVRLRGTDVGKPERLLFCLAIILSDLHAALDGKPLRGMYDWQVRHLSEVDDPQYVETFHLLPDEPSDVEVAP